ncbi:DUF1534 domain-containing protein [Pseudomonas syringae pv. maculicola str. ES4326]|uniref:DUF1534 domain-containing protein n=1 Tax=Pseudomonas syringae pv. maculicola str. ES4326 TaxID=629265 RepID=A0A8T8CA10_PSEYM|nr:DUF1534 domain-containing protein [Pseudomonas syringae pv. maculicola str. ES4326]
MGCKVALIPLTWFCLSLLTLQRRNALDDAPRHKSALRRMLKIGRRASRTALPRGAWER